MKTIIILFLFVTLLSGCVAKITSLPGYNENILLTLENIKKLASLAEFQVSYIKSVLGNDSGKISSEAIACLDSILSVVRQAKKEQRELTAEELGLVAGKWDRFAYLVGPRAMGEIVGLISSVL